MDKLKDIKKNNVNILRILKENNIKVLIYCCELGIRYYHICQNWKFQQIEADLLPQALAYFSFLRKKFSIFFLKNFNFPFIIETWETNILHRFNLVAFKFNIYQLYIVYFFKNLDFKYHTFYTLNFYKYSYYKYFP